MKAIHNMLFAAAALTLAACTSEERLDNPNAPVELRLTSALEVQTRAAHGLDTQLKDGEAVHVWVDDAATGEELYPNKTLTAGNGGMLTGGETMYFPATGNNASIYAIHGNFGSADLTNFWGTEQTHTVAQDQRSVGDGYAQSDLVYAKLADVSRNGNPTTVNLTFTHLLSKVEVVLKQGTGNPTISKVELLNTLLDATFTPAKADATIAVAASGTAGENPIEIDTDLDDMNEAIIVPQTLAAGTDFIRITTAEGGELFYSLPEAKTFDPAKKYRYTITAHLTGLDVTADISDWEDGGDQEGEATLPVPIYKELDEAAVGDYYMADGRVLSQESRLTPALASQVIGIVFYAGQHDSDNADYTNTGIGQQKCHGYAVALTDVHNDSNDRLRWEYGPNWEYERGVDASTSTSDWQGYYNHQKFHKFVNDETNKTAGWEMKHFPAALACETYGNRTVDQDGNSTVDYDWQKPLAAPDNTSGWFLPSCGQLKHLYENCSSLSARMTDVKNSTPADCNYKNYIQWFTSWYYWSSTELSQGSAWRVYFDRGYAYSLNKNGTNDVRAVLAF